MIPEKLEMCSWILAKMQDSEKMWAEYYSVFVSFTFIVAYNSEKVTMAI